MKIELGFGVALETKTLSNGKQVSILDNNLPNDYWDRSKLRQLL